MSYEDIYHFKNILDQQNLAWLQGELEILRSNPTNSVPRTVKHTRYNQLFIVRGENPLKKRMESFFSALFPFEKEEYTFCSINYYELQNSYGLHCDNLGKERGFYQAVIPIKCPPQPTYTIVFDQTSSENVEWVAPIFKKPLDYKPHYNKPIFDANWFGDWKNEYRISNEQGERFWGPLWKEVFLEAYKGFSIKYAYEWSVGDVFVFNSKYTHCASELEKLNIESKTGLLICLQKV